MAKKGDTLVEVTIAIGIFSLVAIAISSVMSSGTSGAQLALETTLAREEIDAQADTLRFIHNAYSSDKENTDQALSSIWKKITDNAVNLKGLGNDQKRTDILQYAPTSCEDAYNNDLTQKYAFIINPRQLKSGNTAYINFASGKLIQASTYPRLIYGSSSNNDDAAILAENSWSTLNDLYRAEGIYIIAVKDNDSTTTVDVTGNQKQSSAFYDFYIRTCWYGAGGEEPSTISTVIRLNSLDSQPVAYPFTINFMNDSDTLIKTVSAARSLELKGYTPAPRNDYTFLGWCDQVPVGNGSCSGNEYSEDSTFYNTSKSVRTYNLYAIWRHDTKVDVNMFITGDDHFHNTGGHQGAIFDLYINNELKVKDATDFYEYVPLGSTVKVIIHQEITVNGVKYTLENASSICLNGGERMQGCSVSGPTNGLYTIYLPIESVSKSAKLNSSNEYAVNIEPSYRKK